jgi:radical SAM superfamily enzyme YgiQ (UPF0313 family)
MKILFQEPFVPRSITYGKYSESAGNNTFPIGMASLARHVRDQGHHVTFLDPTLEGMNTERYLDFLKNGNFDLVGLGSTTLQIDYTLRTLDIVKSHFPSIHTVLGGVHGTLMPELTLGESQNLDFIMLGEAEKPFSRLLRVLEERGGEEALGAISGLARRDASGNVVVQAYDEKDRLSEEELLPPLYEIFPMRRYKAQISFAKRFPSYSVIASRGCPFSCSFCNATNVLGRKVRYKPVPMVIAEIAELKEKYGARGIMFMDSTFTASKRWVLEFCYAYQASGLCLPWACGSRVDTLDEETLLAMKRAGCWSLAFGVESGNQKSLDLVCKGVTVEKNRDTIRMCLDHGMHVLTSYILCLPGENLADAMNTVRFARDLENQMAFFYLPVPYPKTGLWDTCNKVGQLRKGAPWSDYNAWDYSNPVYVNPAIGKKGMQRILRKAFLTFYTTPAVIWRNLKELLLLRQSPQRYLLCLKGFLASVRRGR